jgi:hypothetical protein
MLAPMRIPARPQAEDQQRGEGDAGGRHTSVANPPLD